MKRAYDVTKETNPRSPLLPTSEKPLTMPPKSEPPTRVGHPVGKNEKPAVLSDPPPPERGKSIFGSDGLPDRVTHADIKATSRRLGYGRW
jgi:hypothetical protein